MPSCRLYTMNGLNKVNIVAKMRHVRILIISVLGLLFYPPQQIFADSIFVDFGVDTLNVCMNEPVTLSPHFGGGQPNYSFSWSNGDTGSQINFVPTQGTTLISVTIQDTHGDIARDTLILQGYPECVFPGDANGDRLANNLDILALGRSFGGVGDMRPDPHFNWIGQPAPQWLQNLPSGVDFVHSDTDGSGIVDFSDLHAIDLNYSGPQTLPGLSSPTNGAPLYIEILSNGFLPGDTIEAAIMLGTASQPLDSAYGIAFSVDYSSLLLQGEKLKVDFSNSWLGDDGINMIAQEKNFSSIGQLDIGMSRTDLQTINGYGRIATIIVVIEDLSGKKQGEETIEFIPGKVSAFSSDGHTLAVGASGLSVGVLLSNGPTFESLGLTLYPNPSNGSFAIKGLLPDQKLTDISFYNLVGEKIELFSQTKGGLIQLEETKNLIPGIYFLQATINNQLLTERVVIY